MQRSYEEVRALEAALLFGRIEEARTHAAALAALAPDAHPRGSALGVVHARAQEIMAAADVGAALPSFADLVVGCGSCHRDMRAALRPTTSREPIDERTLSSRMARHLWAAELLFDGFIIPSSASRRRGLEVLAVPPLAPERMSADRGKQAELEAFGARLSNLAFEASSEPTDDAPASGSFFYVRVLEACTGCHAVAAR